MPKLKAAEEVSESLVGEESSDSATSGSVGNSFASMYAKAALPFEKTYQRQIRGGRMLDYITGEQAASRLQEVYGDYDWTVGKPEVIGTDVVVSGTITVKTKDGDYIQRAGFGGSQIKSFGGTTDLGNDLKAAETSAFKRAAAKFGVGLYLYERDESVPQEAPFVSTRPSPGNLAPVAFPSSGSGSGTTGVIQAKSATGLNIGGTWYNVSKFAPIDLAPFERGMAVTIAHAPNKTFIDGVSMATATSPSQAAAPEDDEAF